jgi:MoaA/NifB/PqqE/SkfB family radical SAM enzyme
LGLSQRVVTNASRITRSRAQLLAGSNVEVGVSLHSANPEINNRLTGTADAFQRAMDALDLLISSEGRCFVQYSPTRLDPGGLGKLAEFLRNRYGQQIAFIDVNRLLPFGEAAEDKAQVVLDADGWWRVIRSVGELALSGWKMRVESVPHCWVRQHAENDGLSAECLQSILSCIRPCYMGINQLALNPVGLIKACPGGPAIDCNLNESIPSLLWDRHPAFLARRLLFFLPKECVDYGTAKICTSFYECIGGCRSAAGQSMPERDPLFTGRMNLRHMICLSKLPN